MASPGVRSQGSGVSLGAGEPPAISRQPSVGMRCIALTRYAPGLVDARRLTGDADHHAGGSAGLTSPR
mgnify:CR=1 FL=1